MFFEKWQRPSETESAYFSPVIIEEKGENSFLSYTLLEKRFPHSLMMLNRVNLNRFNSYSAYVFCRNAFELGLLAAGVYSSGHFVAPLEDTANFDTNLTNNNDATDNNLTNDNNSAKEALEQKLRSSHHHQSPRGPSVVVKPFSQRTASSMREDFYQESDREYEQAYREYKQAFGEGVAACGGFHPFY
ncbi:hypothetical protein D6783_00990 [Candidatus Woesearchaeota archaeon]|nr:MAG: hypothetical protein D6783_00990 [Candidatus Woesearchaeota archaeon]